MQVDQTEIIKKLGQEFDHYLGTEEYKKGVSTEKSTPILDSNMNLVLKITLDNQKWLLKHAEPWVRKYPHIPAPVDRTFVEAMFYQYFASNQKLKDHMPDFLGFNKEKNFLVLKYLDDTQTGMSYYQEKNQQGMTSNIASQVINYLSILHQMQIPRSVDWSNKKLRQLNYHHIFVLPLQLNSGINLDTECPGSEEISLSFKKDRRLGKVFKTLGDLYLHTTNGVPLHGDIYPGSLLIQKEKVIVIDPEFCFIGPSEFDLGVFFAHHLILGGNIEEIENFAVLYQEKIKNRISIDKSLYKEFCGIEIIRRLLGAARLPIKWNIKQYKNLLELARSLCLDYRN